MKCNSCGEELTTGGCTNFNCPSKNPISKEIWDSYNNMIEMEAINSRETIAKLTSLNAKLVEALKWRSTDEILPDAGLFVEVKFERIKSKEIIYLIGIRTTHNRWYFSFSRPEIDYTKYKMVGWREIIDCPVTLWNKAKEER